jgi:NADH-quinone oxidoreductase subunit J
MLTHALFYMFSFFLIFAASSVVLARNTVHSVLFLILTFFNAAGLFLIQGAEFLAMLLVVVYVGAVAVLFLFVVMMFHQPKERMERMHPWVWPSLSLASVLLLELGMTLWAYPGASFLSLNANKSIYATNVHHFGALLYTEYFLPFQLSGLLLLLAMVGAVALTYKRSTHKRQVISEQVMRYSKDTLTLHDVDFKKGVS